MCEECTGVFGCNMRQRLRDRSRQQLAQAHTLVGTQIVKQDDLSWPQGRSQDVLDICLEHRAAYTALDHQARTHTPRRQRADRRGICWRVARERSDCSLTAWGTSITPRHIEIGAELVDHDQISCLDVFLLDKKAGTLPSVTFTGNQRLFFRVSPSRRMARPSVHLGAQFVVLVGGNGRLEATAGVLRGEIASIAPSGVPALEACQADLESD